MAPRDRCGLFFYDIVSILKNILARFQDLEMIRYRHAQSVMGPKYSNDEGSGLCIIAYRYTSTTVSFPLNAIAARLIKRQFESPTIFHCAVMQLFFFTNKLKNFIAQRSMMSFVTVSKKDCRRKVGGKYLFITKFE